MTSNYAGIIFTGVDRRKSLRRIVLTFKTTLKSVFLVITPKMSKF